MFELVLGLLLAGVGLTLLGPALGVPWPALLALAGAALAFIPWMPQVELEPDLALALFVAPALMDAAFDASPRDLRTLWAPVSGLVIGAVCLTVAAVAVIAHTLVPTLPWAAAVGLGAIVAPPDAAAATAILREVRLPHRISVILEGESLLNDASALLIYRFAVAAAVSGAVTIWSGPLLILAAGGGAVLGYALARLHLAITTRVRDETISTVVSFLATFGVWLLAEALHLSAVLTLVAFAVTMARSVPERTGARRRRTIYAVWDVAIFTLNVLAFVLIGLQLRGILDRIDGDTGPALIFAGSILATVIAVRAVWVFGHFACALWHWRRDKGRHPARPEPNIRNATVITWCGMRGIVTIAAALALPPGFPGRDIIVLASFAVVLGTLVLQGMTLPVLLRHLTMPADDSVARETVLARSEAARAGLDSLARFPGRTPEPDLMRFVEQSYAARIAGGSTDGAGRPDPSGLRALKRWTLAAERSRLAALRREGVIGEEAFHRVEEELDWIEAGYG